MVVPIADCLLIELLSFELSGWHPLSVAVVVVSDAPAALNLFCSKTKGLLQDSWSWSPSSQAWTCHLAYTSVLRSVRGQGSAGSKKAAKAIASDLLIRGILKAIQD